MFFNRWSKDRTQVARHIAEVTEAVQDARERIKCLEDKAAADTLAKVERRLEGSVKALQTLLDERTKDEIGKPAEKYVIVYKPPTIDGWTLGGHPPVKELPTFYVLDKDRCLGDGMRNEQEIFRTDTFQRLDDFCQGLAQGSGE